MILSSGLACENTSARADYTTKCSVIFYLSDDKSTHVNLSPRAKHLLVGCIHSAQKCIVASHYVIKMLHLNCVIAGVIHLWNGNQQALLFMWLSLTDDFLRHRKMNKAPLAFWSINTVESSKLYTVASRSRFFLCTLKQMVPFLSMWNRSWHRNTIHSLFRHSLCYYENVLFQ